MSTRTVERSFAGGEIAPELYGRTDLTKNQTGLKNCQNFITVPHGPARNRPGLTFVQEVKDSTQQVNLIEFIYSTTQTMVLEFGNLYLRFHTQGGNLLESALTIGSIVGSTVNLTAHGYLAGDWVYIGGIPFVVATAATNSFTVNYVDGVSGAPVGSTAARVYTLTTAYTAADVMDIHYVQSADVLTIVHQNYPPAELRRLGATNWTLTNISFASAVTAPTGVAVVATTGTGTRSYSYTVTAVMPLTLEEGPQSSVVTCTNDLTVGNNFNTLSWSAVSGAIRYYIYKSVTGLYGYVGQTDTLTIDDHNITPDLATTPPIADTPIFASAGNYPASVSYFEQRRWFGGTLNAPQSLWATRSATESSMTYSLPTKDTDRIAIRIAARQANTVRHIVPLQDLVLLTSGAEWKVSAANSDVLTPTTISVHPQSYIGSSNVQPVATGKAILFNQARGGRIREVTYQWSANGYVPADVSIMAPHLFDGFSIVDMAFCQAPVPVLWCVRSDGVLLGMTYLPDQQVQGWHHHSTDGLFESVACVTENNEDILYAVVKRTINSRVVRYVERMSTMQFDTLANANFVDAGLRYSGSAITVVTGLRHLEGKTVSILADGAVMPQAVVVGGSVTLSQASSVITVGLPIVADLETLPVSLQIPDGGNGTGHTKNVSFVYLRVNQSSGIWVGPSTNRLTQVKQRTIEPYGSPPNMISGEIPVAITPYWGRDGTVCVRQLDPLPLTVVSISLEMEIG